MARDPERIRDIVAAADLIAEFLESRRAVDFLTDALFSNAVLRQLIVAGEAVCQLSEQFTARHAEIPWRAIANFRHRLVHDYSGIDMTVAWEVASIHLPMLRRRLAEILPDEFPPEP